MTADRRKSVESKIALSSLLRRHRRWSGLVRVTDRGDKKAYQKERDEHAKQGYCKEAADDATGDGSRVVAGLGWRRGGGGT